MEGLIELVCVLCNKRILVKAHEYKEGAEIYCDHGVVKVKMIQIIEGSCE